jgi:threonylcarbamoyladenosine tRNA methylthiotransferase MtaB
VTEPTKEATPRRRTFSSRTLGCKVNQVEGEQVVRELLDVGLDRVDEGLADVVIVHTCAVTGEADAKARKAVRRALSLSSRPIVVVTGCMAAVDPSALRALGERVVVEPDVRRVALAARRSARFDDIGTAANGHPLGSADMWAPADATSSAQAAGARLGTGFHTRVMVKVQDGCDAFCTYCIVPLARGVPRSVPLEQVLAECSELVSAGAREIVLTGINVGRYEDGRDRLAELLAGVARTGIERIRLSSIEPGELRDETLAALSSIPAVCEHLHVPLQSGSDAVLQAMGRSYTTAEYAERIAAVRAALPDVAISTDVIAGFPGETEEQAEETLDFCRRAGFARLHVFRYSRRKGTRAAARPDQIPASEGARRAAALRTLDAEMRSTHALSAIGQVREVLIERMRLAGSERPARGEDGGARDPRAEARASVGVAESVFGEGVTRDYLRVRVRLHASGAETRDPEGDVTRDVASALVPGSLVNARLVSLADDGVIEAVVEEGRNPEAGG